MKVKVFTMAYNASSGGFDDEEMQAFQSSREVLELREHFFTHEGCPVWAVMLSYRDLGEPPPWERERVKQEERRQTREDLMAALDAGGKARFEAVRQWRNERSKKEGKPPYALLTNRELFEVARRNPSSLNTLREIEGIGETKGQDYGEEILKVLKAAQGQSAPTPAQPKSALAITPASTPSAESSP